jgi:hypothetical protein
MGKAAARGAGMTSAKKPECFLSGSHDKLRLRCAAESKVS